MTSNIPEELSINERIKLITDVTTYNKMTAMTKLHEYNMNHEAVINAFNNVGEITSVNREIYTQIRGNMSSVMKNYRDKNPETVDNIVEFMRNEENNTGNQDVDLDIIKK